MKHWNIIITNKLVFISYFSSTLFNIICIYSFLYIYIYIYIIIKCIETQSSLTLSCHPSLSSITRGRSSRLHLVFAQSWYMKATTDQPTLAHLFVGVHKRTLLMSLSLLLKQCSACLILLTWMVYEMEGKWLCSCCFVECCF